LLKTAERLTFSTDNKKPAQERVFAFFFADSAPVTNGGLKIQTGLFA
jgi:hypothetical protein